MKYLEAKKKKKVYLYEIGFEKKAVLRFRRWRFIFNPILFSVGIELIITVHRFCQQVCTWWIPGRNSELYIRFPDRRLINFSNLFSNCFFFCYTISNFEQIFSNQIQPMKLTEKIFHITRSYRVNDTDNEKLGCLTSTHRILRLIDPD